MESTNASRLPISILIVEDEGITLEYIFSTLARKFPDITFHKALNGRTGLDLFKTHMPDIVITDINMPDVGGIQMAEIIHGIKPDTKFIVTTGDTDKLTVENSVGIGFEIAHYFVKPILFSKFFAAVEQCIGEIYNR